MNLEQTLIFIYKNVNIKLLIKALNNKYNTKVNYFLKKENEDLLIIFTFLSNDQDIEFSKRIINYFDMNEEMQIKYIMFKLELAYVDYQREKELILLNDQYFN